MKVFLLRHAHAEYGGPDSERPLSKKGHAMAGNLAAFIGGNPFFRFDEIWSSPFLRARQTADPFIHLLPDPGSIYVTDLLLPMKEPAIIMEKIQNAAERNLLLVGHNPHLSTLASTLLSPLSARISLSLKKTSMVAFKQTLYSKNGYELSAYLPASALGLKSE